MRHKTMKTRIRPIDYLFNMAIFNRISMNIIHMTVVILLSGYRMRTKTPLPDSLLPTFYSTFRFSQGTRKMPF